MANVQPLHLTLFLVLVALAASRDVAARIVPNWICVSLAASGVAVHLVTGGGLAAAKSAAVALALGAVLLLPWGMRVLGGGDLKLAVGVATWLGPDRLASFLLATAIVGGVIAVPFLRSLGATRREVLLTAGPAAGAAGPRRGAGPVRRVPYAVAIALGACIALVGR